MGVGLVQLGGEFQFFWFGGKVSLGESRGGILLERPRFGPWVSMLRRAILCARLSQWLVGSFLHRHVRRFYCFPLRRIIHCSGSHFRVCAR